MVASELSVTGVRQLMVDVILNVGPLVFFVCSLALNVRPLVVDAKLLY